MHITIIIIYMHNKFDVMFLSYTCHNFSVMEIESDFSASNFVVPNIRGPHTAIEIVGISDV